MHINVNTVVLEVSSRYSRINDWSAAQPEISPGDKNIWGPASSVIVREETKHSCYLTYALARKPQDPRMFYRVCV